MVLNTLKLLFQLRNLKSELNQFRTRQLLDDWANDSNVEKLSVKVKDDFDSKVESIDLIHQAIKRSLIYEYREAGQLNAQNIFFRYGTYI